MNVRMTANASGIRIPRAKYSAAIVPNSTTKAHLLELGDALRKSTALLAESLSGRLWKNGRFQKKAISEAVGAFTPCEGPDHGFSIQASGNRRAQPQPKRPNM
jgi:hypothetical protein